MAKLMVEKTPKPTKEKKRKLELAPEYSPSDNVSKKHKKKKSKSCSDNHDTAHSENSSPLDTITCANKALRTSDANSTNSNRKRKLENVGTLSVIKKLKERQEKSKEIKELKPHVQVENDNDSVQYAAPKMSLQEAFDKYPILKDEEVIKKFQAVQLSNNQKGRIRQTLVNFFKGIPVERVPDAINLKLADIFQNESLEEKDYRKIRILHNMLKTSVMKLVESSVSAEPKKKKKKNKKVKQKQSEGNSENTGVDEHEEKKVLEESYPQVHTEKKSSEITRNKGPKRYVVFVGNLPYDVDRDAIMRHFSSIVGKIKDVRIPKKCENKKGGIAYVELADETSYQMALSKHHSMFENRRINVLYTTTGKSKIDKKEAKGKRAKLLALQKSGQLVGSTPLASKRSARRKKQRAAQAREQN